MAAERPYFTRLMEAAGIDPTEDSRRTDSRLAHQLARTPGAEGSAVSFRAECPKSGCASQPASKRPLGPAAVFYSARVRGSRGSATSATRCLSRPSRPDSNGPVLTEQEALARD